MHFNFKVDDFVNNLDNFVVVNIDGPNKLRGFLHVGNALGLVHFIA